MPTLEHFCKVDATLEFNMIGKTPMGVRIDMPFHGTATGPHWDGERPVEGIDHVTVRGDGNMDLVIRGRIGEGRETVGYRATGVSVAIDRTTAEPQELVLFETGDESLDFLNTSVGVVLGRGEGTELSLDFFLVRR